MTNNPTIDGVSRERRTFPCWSCKEPVSMKARNDADGNCPHCNVELDIEEWPFPSSTLREHCETCGDYGQVGNILNAEPCPDCAPAVERKETVEKVDHPNFLEFAICDTCAAESLCCEVAPNEHLCGGCYWAPINEKAHADQVAALQSTIARIEARITQLESEAEFAAATYQAARDRIAELESGRGEPVAWMCFDGEGNYDFTEDPETAEAWRKSNGEQYADWLTPLFTAPPAPVAVVLDERAAFDSWAVEHGRVVGYNGWRNDFEVWLARACLDATAALNEVKS